jgi:cytochrome P450
MAASDYDHLPTVDMTAEPFWREPALTVRPLLESTARAAYTPGFDTVMFLRHRECADALLDGRLGQIGSRFFEMQGWTDGPWIDWTRQNIVMVDPPDHTRLRKLVNRAFTPRAIERMGEVTATIARRLCTEAVEAAETRSIEFVHGWARLVPLHAICELLGIPRLDHERMGAWTEALSAASGVSTPEGQAAGNQAMGEFMAYVGEQIALRRDDPRGDLLSDLIVAEESGDRLSHEELVTMVIQLMFAGHETTRNLLGNLLYRLLERPEQMARLRADRSLIASAVEESMRYDPPITFTSRIAKQDLEIDGLPIAAGQLAVFFLTAANFDPEYWVTQAGSTDPYIFDIARFDGRTDLRHLSLGYGIHFCLGANLARLEAKVALNVLLDSFSSIELAGHDRSQWTAWTPLRGRERLDLTLVP